MDIFDIPSVITYEGKDYFPHITSQKSGGWFCGYYHRPNEYGVIFPVLKEGADSLEELLKRIQKRLKSSSFNDCDLLYFFKREECIK